LRSLADPPLPSAPVGARASEAPVTFGPVLRFAALCLVVPFAGAFAWFLRSAVVFLSVGFLLSVSHLLLLSFPVSSFAWFFLLVLFVFLVFLVFWLPLPFASCSETGGRLCRLCRPILQSNVRVWSVLLASVWDDSPFKKKIIT